MAETSQRETERLAALHQYAILDTPAEASFDDLVELAAHVAQTPTALITLVDAERQWIKARHGSSLIETARAVSFCTHVVESEAPMVVPDALDDPRFTANPLVMGPPNIRFYAGFPIVTRSNQVLGSLCVIDAEPRTIGADQMAMLEKLARRVMSELDLRVQLRSLAAERLARANDLLTVVTAVQTSYLHGEPIERIYKTLLDRVLGLTNSEFGFVGEVLHDDKGRPYLKTYAATNIAWDAASRQFYNDNVASGLEFRNLDSLFGTVLTTAQPVITNTPNEDPRRAGLPPGHPRLHAFMGLPVFKGGVMVGMVGVANRPGGYDSALAEFLGPFLATCGGIIEACRNEARLELAHGALARSHDELTRILDLLNVAILGVDAEGIITYRSEACVSLLGLPGTIVGRPWSDVLAVDAGALTILSACMALPEAQRGRVGARMFDSRQRYHVEVDVRDDPRAPGHQFMFIYDVTDRRELERAASDTRHRGLVGRAATMTELFDAIDQVAAGSWTVLIEGETGTGKELVARAIHENSERRTKPFIAVNCAGLTDTLLGSQLFGHVRGSFTGANKDQVGLFEAANGGTILLDEIGDISLAMQRTLLRVVQEREVVRVGENHPRRVDVRILAATHRDIHAMAERGEFRSDLLYRIRVARILVPPLRSRREDIPLLVAAFLADPRVTGGKQLREVDPAALELLEHHHHWPGNVRELRAAIEHAVVACRDGVIRTWDLPRELSKHSEPTAERANARGQEEGSADTPRAAIEEALRASGGNRSKAARLLGISRATLYRRIEALGIG